MTSVTRLAAVLMLAAACGPKAPATKPATTPVATATPAPVAQPVPPPTPEAKPVSPEMLEMQKRKTIEAALVRVPEIMTSVAALRGLPFKQDVPSAYQSSDDFRAFVRAETQHELAPEKAAAMSTALAHLGIFKEPVDLATVVEDTMASQAAAYYDPKQGKFFVVMAYPDATTQDVISAHELMHALQDQHFPLRPYYGEPAEGAKVKPPALTEDQLNARRFVVEGEASFVMLAHVSKQNGMDPFAGPGRPMLSGMIGMMAKSTTLDQIRVQAKAQAAGGDANMKKAAEAIDKVPLAILVPLFMSYTQGAQAVDAAHKHGGWAAVSSLFTQPPDSTEQVLHPEKLFPTRDVPVAVTLPTKLKGLTEVHSDTLGELQWRVFFETWAVPGTDAAAGWDGDRVGVYRDAKGGLVGFIATEWDREADAIEFALAYQATLAKRFPGTEPSATSAKRPDGGTVTVQRVGTRVYIVDGGTVDRMSVLTKGARFK